MEMVPIVDHIMQLVVVVQVDLEQVVDLQYLPDLIVLLLVAAVLLEPLQLTEAAELHQYFLRSLLQVVDLVMVIMFRVALLVLVVQVAAGTVVLVDLLG